MARPLFLCLLVLVPALVGCAASRPHGAPVMTQTERIDFGHKLEQLMQEDQANFDILSRKMDEYQNLLALCEGIREDKEEGSIAAACGPGLKSLKQEIENLSDLLRGGK